MTYFDDIQSAEEQHRRQRKLLNPLFSAKHLRDMTPVFTEIIERVSPIETYPSLYSSVMFMPLLA